MVAHQPPSGNWLVTGGCGFVGSALVHRLRAAGAAVRIVDNLSVGSPDALPNDNWLRLTPSELDGPWGGAELVVANIEDADIALRAATGADVIIHLAARTGVIPSIEDPAGDCLTNVIGTLNYLEGARQAGVKRFVMASSSAPLGAADPPFHEEIAPRPISPYGASKMAGEGYCAAYHGSYGLEAVALRISNIYGPGSTHKTSVVANFINNALEVGQLTIYGDGQQCRDFIYIEDLIKAFILAAQRPGIGGKAIHVACGEARSVLELASKIRDLIKLRTGREIILHHEPARAGELIQFSVLLDVAKKLLKFKTEMNFEEGLAITVDDFLARNGRSV